VTAYKKPDGKASDFSSISLPSTTTTTTTTMSNMKNELWRETPLIYSTHISERLGDDYAVYLKMEVRGNATSVVFV
jgi:threonine dehydratase